MMTSSIRSLDESDWPAVLSIYRQGIATGCATFETEVPGWDKWNASHLAVPRLVTVDREQDIEQVVAWAALSPVSARSVYAGVAEVSIYVADGCRGRGIGRRLLQALVEAAEGAGFWTLQGGIIASNASSIRLHLSCGFRIVGTRERIGSLAGTWHDVVLVERRSQKP
jgi:L-amino acid N-acyltransferase YncA